MATFLDKVIGPTVPVLEQWTQFAAARHELITQNIANIDTPNYRMRDLSVADFQRAMADALADRARHGGALRLRGEQVTTGPDGRLQVRPDRPTGQNVIFHDQGNRNVEKLMAALAENTLTYNLAAELLKNRFNGLKTAIRQRL